MEAFTSGPATAPTFWRSRPSYGDRQAA